MEKGGTAGTNHPGIIDYKGKTHLTYHSGTLAGGGDYARSECIEDLVWNVDGTSPRIERTDAGCKQLEAFNPYARNEAETICWGNGVKTESCSAGGLNVCDIQNGEY
ncbi:MAG: carbohydrate-binding protein, partial [Oscillospiraceae bacterium]|nr:carbohydrate-binding protein [Oscillospiraceae bacterium]